ncbi:MAG: hypothetical protein IJ877_01265 [Candidatus Gastranaerophilales bacterium]|nr:hypothetical protein [Candidatus Gastranaerophilales bacterium]
MKYIFENFKNIFDFSFRNRLPFSLKNYFEKESLTNILRNIYYFQTFDKYFKAENKKISILDIGSKNWEYVKAQYYFFKTYSKDFVLNGIELDYNRLNTNFYSRYEIAKFYTKNLENTNYIKGDFLEHNQKYDYIIWILPFVSKYPLIKWGLPLKYFKPLEMLSHAMYLLNSKGQMLIVNQGKKEYSIQKELNEKLNLKAEYFGEIEDKFNLFKNKRYICKIVKN